MSRRPLAQARGPARSAVPVGIVERGVWVSSSPAGSAASDAGRIEGRPQDERPRLEPGQPGGEGLDPTWRGRQPAGRPRSPDEVGHVELPALGVGDDRDPGISRGVRPTASRLSRPTSAAPRGIGQGLGRRHADPQPGVRARPQADREHVDVAQAQPGFAQEWPPAEESGRGRADAASVVAACREPARTARCRWPPARLMCRVTRRFIVLFSIRCV